MKLALKELTYYKFKYLLVTLILFLLAFLVLFISALAQGLAKENVSGVEQWNKSEYVIASDADNNLSQSNITKQTNQDVNNVAKGDTIKTAMQKVETDSGKADLMFTQLTKDIQPKPSEGHLPKSNHEVLLNEKLKAEGFNVGDDIKLADEDQTFKISGFADNIMFSHTSMAYVNEDGMKDLKGNHISVIAYDNLNDNQKDEINKLDDVKVISQDDMLNAIPSYNAEQQPLNLMIVFLFVISAIVITAFFYVMTIQKTSQFGILKAIGTKNKALIASLMLQILMITLIGVALAIAIIFILGGVMPVSMPFYLDTNLMLLMVAVFIVVSLIGAVLSLIKVMKIEPLEAIGGE
ncbi:ABC transporter permease [Mammaliicoccus vitulinus]|uniref:ABC transporter permease n=1 Tax=Mammaliicoccus vitulinus TaxID=71237 RepID=UPI000D1D25D2|nr:ABC transporter permease [Mammaliicoccus vitulinus]PTI37050.1 heme ABC transporter permease [Mammaliicoccus vitulinus]PTI90057.1 heme ABC transporter permease [Mammaliicoccus vitulinus]QQT15480.1 ABC transporter permease [Mammaliicoccus vitulinus]QQY19218.1 ABC transporter permease [Mammaliicoccus vitulinus]RIN14006.1 ABC transporter permease [Mammaliicoccus vitulinus]